VRVRIQQANSGEAVHDESFWVCKEVDVQVEHKVNEESAALRIRLTGNGSA
jgi:hypothetical protein